MKQYVMTWYSPLAIVVAFILGGCVKVNNPDVQPMDFRASVRFVNFADMPTNTMAVTIDKSASTAATIAYQNGSSYLDLPAGARFFSFAYGATTDTLHQALTPYTQYTVYSEYEPKNGDQQRSYLLMSERAAFPTTVPFPANTDVVRFINLSSDTAATILGGLTFHLFYGGKDTASNPLGFGDASPYYQAPSSANPQFMVVGSVGDTLMTASELSTVAGRFSVVFEGSKAASSWQAKIFREN